jgi:hypothetical protein
MSSIREHATKHLEGNLIFLGSILRQLNIDEITILETINNKVVNNEVMRVPRDYLTISNIREKYDNAYHHIMNRIRRLSVIETDINWMQTKFALIEQNRMMREKKAEIRVPVNQYMKRSVSR